MDERRSHHRTILAGYYIMIMAIVTALAASRVPETARAGLTPGA